MDRQPRKHGSNGKSGQRAPMSRRKPGPDRKGNQRKPMNRLSGKKGLGQSGPPPSGKKGRRRPMSRHLSGNGVRWRSGRKGRQHGKLGPDKGGQSAEANEPTEWEERSWSTRAAGTEWGERAAGATGTAWEDWGVSMAEADSGVDWEDWTAIAGERAAETDGPAIGWQWRAATDWAERAAEP